MKRRSPFVARLSYLAAIAVLLVPLAWLSQPSALDATGRRTPGGVLARMRDEYKLSQTNLGEIDPTSEVIKLSTLGLRNVAANILWSRAHHNMKTKNWTGLSATLEQITHLQPNFVEIWRFQAWNLSYNVSHEWDDYHDRYYWVIKGIEFLEDGIRYNDQEPRLRWDSGWFISQKIGRSDERIQYRRLFREDDDFHGARSIQDRDNWLLGKRKILDAHDLVEQGERLIGRNPLVFYAYPSLCQINYAGALEEEGTFDEIAEVAWERAEQEWSDYGNRPIAISGGRTIQLKGLERQLEVVRSVVDELDAIEPGLREKIEKEKRGQLSSEEREALEIPLYERSVSQAAMARGATVKIAVTHDEVVDRVEGSSEQRAKARKLAKQVALEEEVLFAIRRGRQIVNYGSWKTRCEAEKSPDALRARKLMYDANQAYIDGGLEGPRQLYESAFEHWRAVYEAFPSLIDDGLIGDELVRVTKQYERLLKQLDEPLPEDFILQDVLDKYKVDPPPR